MEAIIVEWVGELRLVIESLGALIIGIGIVLALYQLTFARLLHRAVDYFSVRLVLSRYLVLALEFQLASDILSTAISPTWTELGQLAATATIRTFLAYFLSLEVREIEREKSPSS